jgi:uncharacterized membrane protein
MKRGFRLLGHPLHPTMLHVPLGLFATALPLDILAIGMDWRSLWAVSFWNIALGLIAAVPTAMSGWLDFMAYVRGGRPERLALIHLTVMLSAVAVFAASLVFRHGPQPTDLFPATLVTATDTVGTLLIALGGWLGGELVYGNGIGIRSDTSEHTSPDH